MENGMKRMVGFLVLTLMGLGPALAKPAETPLREVTLDAASPHMTWAHPLQGGPIRVLFVAPRAALCDAGALAQRIDLEYETFALEKPEDGLALDALLGRPVDVIVLGNLDPAQLPESVQTRMIELAGRGTGLVLAQYRIGGPSPFQEFLSHLETKEDPGIITRGVGEWMASAGEGARRSILVAEQEKSRVVLLEYPGDPAHTHFLVPAPINPMAAFPAYLENAMALAARAVRWAAHREGILWITAVADMAPQGPPDEEIPPGYPREFVQMMRDPSLRQPMRPYRIQLNRPAEHDYTVSVQLRQPDTAVQLAYTCDVPLKKGMESYPVDLLVGPGEYMADFWITGKKGVVDWFTEEVRVGGWPELASVRYSKDFLLPNDTLELTATVRANLRTDRPCTLYARATDPISSASTPGGRLVAEAQARLTKEGGTSVLRLSFADLMAPMVKIEVFAVEGEGRVFSPWELNCSSRDFRYLTVRKAWQAPGINFLVRARHAEEYNERHFLNWLHALGVDSALVPGTESDLFYSAGIGLRALPELTPDRLTASAPDGNVLDPALRGTVRKALGEIAARYWAGGSGDYVLHLPAPNPEAAMRNPKHLEGFAAYLKGRYGHIAALEASWGAGYASWENAVPLSAAEAAKQSRYVPYMDFAHYTDQIVDDGHRFIRDSLRGVDKEARLGALVHEKNALVNEGVDFVAAVENNEVLDALLHVPRKKGDFAAAVFSPGDPGPARAHWWPWNALFHQVPGLWCINEEKADAESSFEGFLAPEGHLTPYMRELVHTVTELKQGLGPLLLAAAPEPAYVGIVDSRSSRHLNEVYRYAGVEYGQSRAAFRRVLDPLNVRYEILETPLFVQTTKQYRVLILPLACALSDADIQVIQSFAQNGGRVIADVIPGVFDEHGMRRTAWPLSGLFGIQYHGPGKMAHVDGEVTMDAKTRPLRAVDADGGVEALTAVAAGHAGDAPLWLSTEKTLLLNHRLHGMESEPALTEYLQGILSASGCTPAWAPGVKGKKPFQGNSFHFRYGSAEIYAVLAAVDAPEQRIQLPFSKKDRVYDLRAGTRIRKPRNAVRRIGPGDACIYASLPYEVSGITVLAPASIVAGRRLPVQIALRTKQNLPGEHLICLELQPDKGAPLPHYRRYVQCPNGMGETFIPLAINEAPGRYTLHARDLLTGKDAFVHIGVSGPLR